MSGSDAPDSAGLQRNRPRRSFSPGPLRLLWPSVGTQSEAKLGVEPLSAGSSEARKWNAKRGESWEIEKHSGVFLVTCFL